MSTIHAKFQDGVFKPVEVVELPENCDVELELRIVPSNDAPSSDAASLDRVYATMSRSSKTGRRDLAERHNEHQP